MTIWQFITTQFCISQDGISVSWGFVAAVFAVLWVKVIIVKKVK